MCVVQSREPIEFGSQDYIWLPGQNGRSVDSPLMFFVGGPGALCIDVEFLAVKFPLVVCIY